MNSQVCIYCTHVCTLLYKSVWVLGSCCPFYLTSLGSFRVPWWSKCCSYPDKIKIHEGTLVYMSYKWLHYAFMIIKWTKAEAYERNHLCWLSPLLVENASVAEKESVRLVLPCRDREVSDISGGVMFDWGLLASCIVPVRQQTPR